jgi:hypothetical protein
VGAGRAARRERRISPGKGVWVWLGFPGEQGARSGARGSQVPSPLGGDFGGAGLSHQKPSSVVGSEPWRSCPSRHGLLACP